MTEIPVTLWGQLRRQSPRYALGVGLLAVYQYSQYWFDTRLQAAVDAGSHGKRDVALVLGAELALVALGAFFVRAWSRVAMFNGGRIAEYELRKALLERLHALGPSFYRRMSTGEIMSRVTNDLVQVRMLLGFAVLNLVNTLFGFISTFSVMLGISWKLTLGSLATLPLLVLVTVRFSQQMFGKMRANQEAIGQMNTRVQFSIAGVRVVRAFGLERNEQAEFEKTNQDYLEKNLSLAKLRGSMGPIMQGITSIGILIVFWFGGHLMLKGEITAGGFLAFYRALARLSWPLIALGFLVGLVQRGRASYARLKDIYLAVPDVVDGTLALPGPVRGELEVRDLSFGYGEAKILRHVSFRAEAGSSLAIVGRTGSGKSTLAILLARLEDTPRGSVFLDGVDICDLPLPTVRGAVGYAEQTAFLFSTTAGRNIGYVLPEPDSEAGLKTIREAAREARILDEVLGLPDGFDTVVGERGVQLSGGQKQRIALARAFVADAKVLVLDDPLSAVDARTEKAILEAIDRQRARRGLILITHRVAAAERCDQILVMDGGEIVERGTHAELARAGGLYAVFAEEQRIERELEILSQEGTEAQAVGT
ncbi:MAG: ABC transporter ATP-binding protein [Polyangiaceae bacterium]|nr:ABC transporter ATP-binding protein [Polyangiaceae bacterium]